MNKNLAEITQEVIDLAKQALGQPLGKATTAGITSATGLTGYSLEAPSKKLFPVLSPLRNRIARVKAPVGATAVNWKAITAINATAKKAPVAFGQRAAQVSTTVVEKSAAFKSYGLDDFVEFEGRAMAMGFEDVRATAGTNLLYAVMIEEEKLVLGGNAASLGTPTAPTVTASATGGSIGAATYSVKVAALTLSAMNRVSVGVAASSPDMTDGFTLASAGTSTGALTGATNKIDASVLAIRGALGYAWFVGVAGSEKLEAITTINKVTLTALAGTGAAVPGADTSGDAQAFDGIIPQIAPAASGAYYKSLDGAVLTAANGGIKELDDLCLDLWNRARISPTTLLVNAQDAINITAKIIATGGAPTLYVTNSEKSGIVGGYLVSEYINRAVGGRRIPIEVHPYLPAGTIIALSELLPYPNTNVATVLEMEMLQEFAQYDWAVTQPKYEFEVRALGVLKHYFPAGCGILTNVGNG